MRFHTFGKKENETLLLIHGVFTPWQIWEKQIEAFRNRYFVVVPALDGHIEERPSEFRSIENEAYKIEKYLIKERGGKAAVICGLSMGGIIAERILERDNVVVNKYVLDGAPLVKTSVLIEKYMTKFYTMALEQSKKRDEKIIRKFTEDFLPERYLENFLRFADTMSRQTIKNMIYSVASYDFEPVIEKFLTPILFMYGSKPNEYYSKMSANITKQFYPNTKIKCFKGAAHAEVAVYAPEAWIDTVNEFLSE